MLRLVTIMSTPAPPRLQISIREFSSAVRVGMFVRHNILPVGGGGGDHESTSYSHTGVYTIAVAGFGFAAKRGDVCYTSTRLVNNYTELYYYCSLCFGNAFQIHVKEKQMPGRLTRVVIKHNPYEVCDTVFVISRCAGGRTIILMEVCAVSSRVGGKSDA